MHVIEIQKGELVSEISRQAKELGILNGAIVSLIGAADSFVVSTMPAKDPTVDNIAEYDMTGEMTSTGEIVDGKPHVHVVMGVEGDRGVTGHLHSAQNQPLVRPCLCDARQLNLSPPCHSPARAPALIRYVPLLRVDQML
ncbi:DUF296 domain-containing protein [Streptosporangium sp. NPDC001681]|uniref:PCC domain-containing protein n=1 Tax=Streptosporangium sp. NPDC001681 TaxID=3154395 RepID=UPI0033166B90